MTEVRLRPGVVLARALTCCGLLARGDRGIRHPPRCWPVVVDVGPAASQEEGSVPQLLADTFEGLTDRDFDIYAPACWSSNVHNLGRMKTKERVLALVRSMHESITEISDVALAVEASSEIPSVWNNRSVKDQWAFLMRGRETRKRLTPVIAANLDLATQVKDPAEYHRHAAFCVHLTHQHVAIGLVANQHATVDLANLLGHAASDPAGLEQAVCALAATPHGADDAPTTATILQRATAARAGESEWFTLVRTVPRQEAIDAGVGLCDIAREVAQALVPLYRFAAWSEDNDHIGVGERLGALARERERQAQESSEAVKDAERKREARAREALERAHERQAWRNTRRSAPRPRPAVDETPAKAPRSGPQPVATPPPMTDRREAPPPVSPGGKRSAAAERATAILAGEGRDSARTKPDRSRPDHRKPERSATAPTTRATRPPRKPAAPELTFEVGETCRLTRGLFAGQEGSIQGRDKKGQYRVRIANLEVRVVASEIEKA